MGYTTDFTGKFNLDRPLEPIHAAYLRQFGSTRRMKRDEAKAELLPDPLRLAAGLPIGEEGGYFVGAGGFAGQDHTPDIIDYNDEPKGQPSLWCQWIPNDDGTAIVWDEGEKFYDYVDWIKYLIHHFLGPWGYRLTGAVTWQGEEPADRGTIIIRDNIVDTVDRWVSLEEFTPAPAQSSAPCTDCGGTGKYVGLFETGPCPTCQGA